MAFWSRWLPWRVPSEIPQYAVLRGLRPLVATPDILSAEQDAFRTSHDRVAERLLAALRGGADAPELTTIATEASGVMMLAPDHGPPVLPVFTSAVRAIDYRECVGVSGTPHYRRSSADELVDLLGGASDADIASWTLDPCPRCTACTIYKSEQFRSSDDVFNVWAITRATTRLRTEVYVRHALDLATGGDWRMASYTGMCALQHVTLDEAHVHLLVGEIAIARGPRSIVEDASRWLRFLGCEDLAGLLDADQAAGVADLSRIVVPTA
jgi:hypothetical protein